MSAVDLATGLYLLLAALGLAVPVAYAGLPVLGQGAFVAVGGFGTALLGPGGAGLPLGLACLLAVTAAGLAGLLVALGAHRLDGASLGLATWALAVLVDRVLVAFPGLSGGAQGLVRPAPAHLVSAVLGTDLVLTPAVHVGMAGGACLLAAGALARLARGPGGRDLAALREGPALAASLGVPVAARRRTALTAGAVLGGVSGSGTCVLLGLVAPADVGPLLSLQLFVAVLVGGARWWGPVLGVALLSLLPPVADAAAGAAGADPQRLRGVLTALLLVAVLTLRRLLARPAAAAPRTAARSDVPLSAVAPAWTPLLLRARGVRVAFGALQALDGVDLALRGGQVHALVGPNGSGKSTLLAVLAGELRPDAGGVEVVGTADRPGVRAGVVRTPQRTVVLPGLTPAQQVAVGARGGSRLPAAVLRHLLAVPSSRRAERRAAAVVAAALARTGLSGVADADPATLTTGEQRLLQVARAAATGAGVLLLDEPAAGMTADERSRLADVLRALAADGAAVLLVEHDLHLVGAVADRVTVLDAGRRIASGRPDAVRADPAVRRAYLGGAA